MQLDQQQLAQSINLVTNNATSISEVVVEWYPGCILSSFSDWVSIRYVGFIATIPYNLTYLHLLNVFRSNDTMLNVVTIFVYVLWALSYGIEQHLKVPRPHAQCVSDITGPYGLPAHELVYIAAYCTMEMYRDVMSSPSASASSPSSSSSPSFLSDGKWRTMVVYAIVIVAFPIIYWLAGLTTLLQAMVSSAVSSAATYLFCKYMADRIIVPRLNKYEFSSAWRNIFSPLRDEVIQVVV